MAHFNDYFYYAIRLDEAALSDLQRLCERFATDSEKLVVDEYRLSEEESQKVEEWIGRSRAEYRTDDRLKEAYYQLRRRKYSIVVEQKNSISRAVESFGDINQYCGVNDKALKELAVRIGNGLASLSISVSSTLSTVKLQIDGPDLVVMQYRGDFLEWIQASKRDFSFIGEGLGGMFLVIWPALMILIFGLANIGRDFVYSGFDAKSVAADLARDGGLYAGLGRLFVALIFVAWVFGFFFVERLGKMLFPKLETAVGTSQRAAEQRRSMRRVLVWSAALAVAAGVFLNPT